ncbi:MAG: hypothetical protein HOD58_09755 [Gammaproteobacteria bacterium]|nr:hypothetical protein [Gammaproteobacteria bacterium]MBT4330198.1 hypothetical protein [Gammaproteobacteria bacterium]MBT5635166.1 hypothetical protein [Gammaproteobacteria bacterium]MBT5747600.1 hypothetical protein [Gammaproteobacteria bacterium]MBT6670487.1 hypothetical protein [Gammaproteobacteria bacterium]
MLQATLLDAGGNPVIKVDKVSGNSDYVTKNSKMLRLDLAQEGGQVLV